MKMKIHHLQVILQITSLWPSGIIMERNTIILINILKNQELNNFPIERCNEKIKKICDSLNLTEDIILTHYTLDYRIMQEEAIELHIDGTDTKPDYAWDRGR